MINPRRGTDVHRDYIRKTTKMPSPVRKLVIGKWYSASKQSFRFPRIRGSVGSTTMSLLFESVGKVLQSAEPRCRVFGFLPARWINSPSWRPLWWYASVIGRNGGNLMNGARWYCEDELMELIKYVPEIVVTGMILDSWLSTSQSSQFTLFDFVWRCLTLVDVGWRCLMLDRKQVRLYQKNLIVCVAKWIVDMAVSGSLIIRYD